MIAGKVVFNPLYAKTVWSYFHINLVFRTNLSIGLQPGALIEDQMMGSSAYPPMARRKLI